MSVSRFLLACIVLSTLILPASADCSSYSYNTWGYPSGYSASWSCDSCGDVYSSGMSGCYVSSEESCCSSDANCNCHTDSCQVTNSCGCSSCNCSTNEIYSSESVVESTQEIAPHQEVQLPPTESSIKPHQSSIILDSSPLAIPPQEDVETTEDPMPPVENSIENPVEPVEAVPTEEEQGDVFDEPMEEPMPTDEEEKDGMLFDESEPEEKSEDDGLEDIFGRHQFQRILEQNGGFASLSQRTWTDNTGNYRCQARIVSASGQNIILANSKGTQKLVPLSRLSDADLLFVKEQVLAQRELLALTAENPKLASLSSK